jgi:hypothetical protein
MAIGPDIDRPLTAGSNRNFGGIHPQTVISRHAAHADFSIQPPMAMIRKVAHLLLGREMVGIPGAGLTARGLYRSAPIFILAARHSGCRAPVNTIG